MARNQSVKSVRYLHSSSFSISRAVSGLSFKSYSTVVSCAAVVVVVVQLGVLRGVLLASLAPPSTSH